MIISEEIARVQAELARVDTKSSAIAGLSGGGLVAVRTVITGSGTAASYLGLFSVILFTIALIILLWAILPRLSGGAGFCRWATMGPDQLADMARSYDIDVAMHGVPGYEAQDQETTSKAELLSVLSVLATRKYKLLRISVHVAIGGVILLALAIIFSGELLVH